MDTLYFDNAATSWPKPEATCSAMDHYCRAAGGSPGRSGHRLSIEAGRIILDARENVARLINAHPFQIIFTKNATEAINIALFGALGPGDHVITSSMEHNAVMRPLRTLEQRGVALTVVAASGTGDVGPAAIKTAIRPGTKAIVLTHASNVTGTVMPVAEIGEISRAHGLIFCVDAAQTAGAVPIDVEAMNIDLLAFTGHKSVYGPQGTGGLYIRKGLEKMLCPLIMGGTGSRSEFEEQPDFMPDKFEAGTTNTPGLAGLGAGVAFILNLGIERIRLKEQALTRHFLEGLQSLPSVTVYGSSEPDCHIPVFSFNIDGLSPSEAALILDEEHGIMCRPGLHCAPAAHRTIGTFPMGTIRFSFGYFNEIKEIDTALKALEKMIRCR
ncbi:MAG: Cysteine desulfurase SufS [Syntrophus sp. SKADARSKE-3]|nr:Cysteine desulfurase SufS [Syntrophus sp. SKADARSKE-3]